MNQALKKTFAVRLTSVHATHELGKAIGEVLQGGSVVGFSGPLGAGKTECIRGVATAFGIQEQITSPTFVLECEYEVPEAFSRKGISTFHHWDLYRISTNEFESELYDYRGDPTKVTLVEWPERVQSVVDLLDAYLLIDLPDKVSNSDLHDSLVVDDNGERLVTLFEGAQGEIGKTIESSGFLELI